MNDTLNISWLRQPAFIANFAKAKNIALIALAAFCLSNGTAVMAQQQPALVTSSLVDEPGAAELSAARALLDVILPPAQRQSMVDGMVQAMMQNITGGVMQSPKLKEAFEQYPAMQGVFQNFIEREETKALQMMQEQMPSMLEAMSRAYARSFSVSQLSEMNDFFASPTGQIYVVKSMAIMSDPDVAQWQRDVMQQSMEDMPKTTAQLVTELMDAAKETPAE